MRENGGVNRKLLLLSGLLVATGAPVVALFGMAAQSRTDLEVVFDGQRLRPCPSKPNCVCSQDEGEARVDPIELGAPGEEAFAAFLERVGAEEGAGEVLRRGSYAHFTFDTALFGFRDDVEFLHVPAEGLVHVRSASRVGHSDLGANAARVERLRALVGERP